MTKLKKTVLTIYVVFNSLFSFSQTLSNEKEINLNSYFSDEKSLLGINYILDSSATRLSIILSDTIYRIDISNNNIIKKRALFEVVNRYIPRITYSKFIVYNNKEVLMIYDQRVGSKLDLFILNDSIQEMNRVIVDIKNPETLKDLYTLSSTQSIISPAKGVFIFNNQKSIYSRVENGFVEHTKQSPKCIYDCYTLKKLCKEMKNEGVIAYDFVLDGNKRLSSNDSLFVALKAGENPILINGRLFLGSYTYYDFNTTSWKKMPMSAIGSIIKFTSNANFIYWKQGSNIIYSDIR